MGSIYIMFAVVVKIFFCSQGSSRITKFVVLLPYIARTAYFPKSPVASLAVKVGVYRRPPTVCIWAPVGEARIPRAGKQPCLWTAKGDMQFLLTTAAIFGELAFPLAYSIGCAESIQFRVRRFQGDS